MVYSEEDPNVPTEAKQHGEISDGLGLSGYTFVGSDTGKTFVFYPDANGMTLDAPVGSLPLGWSVVVVNAGDGDIQFPTPIGDANGFRMKASDDGIGTKWGVVTLRKVTSNTVVVYGDTAETTIIA